MSLTVPRAGTNAGATASLRVAQPTAGADIAQLGDVMARVGGAIRAEADSRALQRAQIDMMEGFNALRLDLDQIGDPDAREALFTERATQMREGFLGAVPQHLRADAELRFDEYRVRQGYAVGREVLDLRRQHWGVLIDRASRVALDGAAGRDPETAEAALGGAEAIIRNAQAQGILTPEQAETRILGLRRAEAETRAEAMLRDDPAGLLSALDTDAFAAWDAPARERLRTQAQNALDRRQTAERAEFGALLQEGRRVLMAGHDYAAAEALAADPRTVAHPEGRAFLATHELFRQMPGLRGMSPDQLDAEVARRNAQPVAPGDEHEIGLRRAMADMAAAQREAWSRDPVAQAQRISRVDPDPLPDPVATDPAELAGALRSRAAQLDDLRRRGFPVGDALLTREEREAFAAAVAPTVEPAQRARLAAAAAAAANGVFASDPDRADAMIGQISDDILFTYVGQMLASGGPEDLATAIFEGQRALANSDLPMPSQPLRRNAWFTNLGGLFDNQTEARARDGLIAAADAIYAVRNRGTPEATETRDFEARWLDALHEAAGGTGRFDARGATGGVQRFRRGLTFVPPGMSAPELNSALLNVAVAGTDPEQDQAALLRSISADGRLPTVAGQPFRASDLRAQSLQLRLVGRHYEVIHTTGTGTQMVLQGEDGAPWLLDPAALLRLGR